MKNFRREHGRGEVEFVTCLVGVIVVVAILLGEAIVGWTTQRTFDGVVEKTYVDRGNTYFVILEDGKDEAVVYENEDAWFFLKWNSGDILRDLNVGERYAFHTYGWRVPLFSWFPNIISATPIDQ